MTSEVNGTHCKKVDSILDFRFSEVVFFFFTQKSTFSSTLSSVKSLFIFQNIGLFWLMSHMILQITDVDAGHLQQVDNTWALT